MQWRGRRQSDNVVDKRKVSGRTVAVGGGALGVIVVVVVVLLQVLGGGGDAADILSQGFSTPVEQDLDAQSAFVSVVLADTEDYWTDQFDSMKKTYEPPTLILFSGLVRTSSGVATSATGPFYSSADKTIYIDLSFYRDLQDKYGAAGDAAQAYVIAHEVGHAVQDQLGVLDKIAGQEAGASDQLAGQLSVRIELQADFYAGLVARYQGDHKWLEEGDIEEAITAANAIGDDKLQQQAQGYVVPDSFTHGTSAQRVRWFRLGYETGDFEQGDTFSMPYSQL